MFSLRGEDSVADLGLAQLQTGLEAVDCALCKRVNGVGEGATGRRPPRAGGQLPGCSGCSSEAGNHIKSEKAGWSMDSASDDFLFILRPIMKSNACLFPLDGVSHAC